MEGSPWPFVGFVFGMLILGQLMGGVVCGSAHAGSSHISKGDLLKNRQYRTNAELVFYVDPTGNDANACTATGTDACLTIQGALNKAPKLLRHQVTVNLAAGNYAGFTVSGFTIDPSIQRATAGILIDGVLANVVPTTGSATGTATSGSAGSGITFGVLTDTAAAWTVSDTTMLGKLLLITGGTGSGQTKMITANTDTTITIAGAFSPAPDATSTYAVQAPSAIITSAAAGIPSPIGTASGGFSSAGVQIFNNNENGTTFGVTLRNVGIATGSTAAVTVSGGQNVELLQVVSTGTGASSINQNSTGTSLTSSFAGQISASNGSVLTVTSNYIAGALAGVASLSRANVAVTTSRVTTTSAAGVPLGASQGAGITPINVYCDCTSGAGSACVSVNSGHSATPAALATHDSAASVGSISVTNCTYGISVGPRGSVVANSATSTITGNALTYAVLASWGGMVTLPATTPTITAVTAELALDNGAAVDSFTTLAATYDCIAIPTTDSKVCRL